MKRAGDKLVCQWHGAEFECAGGNRLKGPARPETRLIILPTWVEAGGLTSTATERGGVNHFQCLYILNQTVKEEGQWTSARTTRRCWSPTHRANF